jgi:putative transposase
MPNSFSQIHLHLVTAVHSRKALIDPSWEDELQKFITGIFQGKGQKLLRINTMPDHVHALIGLRPSMAPSDLIRDVKSDSSRWINEQGICRHPFSWQDGYGAFSVCKRHVDVVAAYIENQKEHHRREGFLEEVKRILKEEGLAVDDRYLFYAPV